MPKQIAIIGAGIGGLSAAVALAAKGYNVEIFEQNAIPGGKLGVIEQDGYRFDSGPSLFTQPDYHAELFALAGERQSDHFTYQRLEEVCRYHFPDGTRINGYSDPQRLAKELSDKLGESEQVIINYLKRSAEKFNIAGDIFLNNPLQKVSTYLHRKVAISLLRMPRLQMFKSLHHLNGHTFRHPHTIQLFDRYATYNGSDPHKASALYSMIPSFEHGQGAYFPDKGMHSIATSIAALAQRQGVRINYNSPVQSLELEEGGGFKLIANGQMIEIDAVINNVDINTFYNHILKTLGPRPERALAQPRSTSALVFYWGIKKQFPALILHNIFFSVDYQKEFRQIIDEGRPADDPTIYLNITSKHLPTDAPAGCENWFVMVNMPPDLGLSDEATILATRQKVLSKLERMLGIAIEPLIANESVLTPQLLQDRTGAYDGALYGSNSNSLLSGFWRHPNFSNAYPGLYFAGGTVHPGGGIPLAIKSGLIAARLACTAQSMEHNS